MDNQIRDWFPLTVMLKQQEPLVSRGFWPALDPAGMTCPLWDFTRQRAPNRKCQHF